MKVTIVATIPATLLSPLVTLVTRHRQGLLRVTIRLLIPSILPRKCPTQAALPRSTRLHRRLIMDLPLWVDHLLCLVHPHLTEDHVVHQLAAMDRHSVIHITMSTTLVVLGLIGSNLVRQEDHLLPGPLPITQTWAHLHPDHIPINKLFKL